MVNPDYKNKINDMIKTFGFGQIDWTGFKSVLIHTLWAMLLTGLYVLLSYFQGHDFGVYQIIAVPAGTFLAGYLKKFAETYSVTLPDTTATVTDESGPIAPLQ